VDVFRNLPRVSWRGIIVPVTERRASFGQEIVKHKFAYRDDEIVEGLGRLNLRFEYTIPFRQDITKGPYENLFLEVYPKFLAACRDSSAGELTDPVLGTFDARCEQLNSISDVNRRDGDDVQVTFVQSPPIDELAAFTMATMSGFDGTVQQAKDFNTQVGPVPQAQLAALGLGQYSGQFDELTSSLNALDQLAGIGAQVQSVYVDRIAATVDRYTHAVNKVADVLEQANELLASPQNAPAIRNARRLVDALNRTKNQAIFPGRRIDTQVINQDMTVSALAQLLGITVAEFIVLNPTAPLPLVLAGTTVSYFQK